MQYIGKSGCHFAQLHGVISANYSYLQWVILTNFVWYFWRSDLCDDFDQWTYSCYFGSYVIWVSLYNNFVIKIIIIYKWFQQMLCGEFGQYRDVIFIISEWLRPTCEWWTTQKSQISPVNPQHQERINPASTKHMYNICTMLGRCRRRWADVVLMLNKYLVFAGELV